MLNISWGLIGGDVSFLVIELKDQWLKKGGEVEQCHMICISQIKNSKALFQRQITHSAILFYASALELVRTAHLTS